MSKPNGKLAFAYQSIARLEGENKQLKADRERYENNSGEWEVSALHWMAEYDMMKAENESLRKVANELRRFAVCEHMHHDKIDQHEHDEPCKVLRRIDSALNSSPENP
jgi:hypothetical protein